MKTKITFLGTGTSCGIPMIGCNCKACTSLDPKDKRWRASILIERGDTRVVIDTGYEFRLQCLRAGIKDLSAVLYTHTHPDHLVGLDDLRSFSKQGRSLPIWASKDNLDFIKNSLFSYAFFPGKADGLPHLEPHIIEEGVPFKVGSIEFLPFFVDHGCRVTTGFRFGKSAYVTDVSNLREEENLKYLKGLDILIIDGLMEEEHPSHLTFEKAIDIGEKCGAKRVYFTHITHGLTHKEIEEKYRGRATPSYDTLFLEVEDE